MLTQARLKERLSYDPATGVFRWETRISRYSSRVRIGGVAGWTTDAGYRSIRLDGKNYPVHRLAFLYVEGAFPVEDVDHINGIRTDNRWSNLRHATSRVNAENQRRAMRTNQVGLLGVCPYLKKFKAQITLHGEKIYLGLFDTPEQAHTAYLAAKRELHDGCTI